MDPYLIPKPTRPPPPTPIRRNLVNFIPKPTRPPPSTPIRRNLVNFSHLPDELILPILIDLPIVDLIHFCQTDKRIQNLCQDEILWRERLRKDYGYDSIPQKYRNLTWQQFYMQLATDQVREIDVYYKDKYIGRVLVGKFDTYYQVKRSLILLLRKFIGPQVANIDGEVYFHDTDEVFFDLRDYNTEDIVGTIVLSKFHYTEKHHLIKYRLGDVQPKDYLKSKGVLWNVPFYFVITRYR